MQSVGDDLERLRGDLTCPICAELFKKPVMLGCGHHFCLACIKRHWEAAKEGARCPQCDQRASTQALQATPLLDSVVARVRELGSQGEGTGKRKRGMYCETHDEKLKLFCQEDQVPICVVCGCSQQHKSHVIAPLDEVLQEYKVKLQALGQQIHTELGAASQCLGKVEHRIAALKEDSQAIQLKIATEFAHMRALLDQEEEALKARVLEDEEEKRRTLESNRMHVKGEMIRLEQAARDMQGEAALCDSPARIKDLTVLLSRGDWAFKKPVSESVRLSVEEHVGPLQYRVWMRMKQLISPGLIPLTLDPDTANAYLNLSSGNTSVKTTSIKREFPANPMRFEHYLGVLGSEGLSAGRRYWEVWVAKKTEWELGVVGESVNRKGPQNVVLPKNAWLLRLKDGKYEGHGENVVRLWWKTPLEKVGVFADYDEGKVVFYNAEGMIPLLAFSHRFEEKIFPLFSPGFRYCFKNRRALKIVTP
ncbi:zinc-binding protein A33 [Amia ocellicauda]|uniref:zinc-binding protein A33 n=1 Tax=Amia ocellicauda TaxID=2972642 RepID=UPI0034644F67